GVSSNADLYLNATQKTVAVASPFDIGLGTLNGIDRGDIEFGAFFRSFKFNDPDKQFQVRIDRQLTSRDNFSARFLQDREDIPFGATLGTSTFEGFDADSNSRYYNFLMADSHVFSPSFTNETRIAYNRINLGFPVSDPNGPGGKLPRINIQLI